MLKVANLPPKLHQIGGFSDPNFVLHFFDSLKFCGTIARPATMPLAAAATATTTTTTTTTTATTTATTTDLQDHDRECQAKIGFAVLDVV